MPRTFILGLLILLEFIKKEISGGYHLLRSVSDGHCEMVHQPTCLWNTNAPTIPETIISMSESEFSITEYWWHTSTLCRKGDYAGLDVKENADKYVGVCWSPNYPEWAITFSIAFYFNLQTPRIALFVRSFVRYRKILHHRFMHYTYMCMLQNQGPA